MAEEGETEETKEGEGASEVQTFDYSWMPETFVKDGKPDTDGFRTTYDELVSFKAQAEEKAGLAPKSADEYSLDIPEELNLPEGLTIPEGFKPELDMNDPDLPTFREIAHKHGLSQEAVSELMQLEAVRMIRSNGQADTVYTEEMAKLGPDSKARLETIERQVKASLPEAQAQAVVEGIHSADALRGLEALMSKNARAPTAPPIGVDTSDMSPKELIRVGLSKRQAS